MKLEKREISLNERDSLKDGLATEKALLLEYAHSLEKLVGKERKTAVLDSMREAGEDLLFVCACLQGLDEN